MLKQQQHIDWLRNMARRQHLQQHFDRITKLIHQIQYPTTLHPEEEALGITSLHQFEMIERPFQLIQAGIELCATVFAPESLAEIARADEESINAWAIACLQTLQTQLRLLELWQPQLASLPLPEALKQQIGDRAIQLQQIAEQQSQLLQSTGTLLSQEAQLRQDAKALQQLKKKAKVLKAIKTELQTTDLDTLRDRISLQEEAIGPQHQALETLKQHKAQLDRECDSLQQQRTTLAAQINHLQQRHQHLETSTCQTAKQLIALTATEQQRLSPELNSLLADLSSQQQEYQQTQQELATAVEQSNRYQQQTHHLREHLLQYYQSNQELAERLPVNRQKIDGIVKTIQENLAQLDQELARALQAQEASEQKTILTF
jgi:chromosome segregation ATPase